MAEIRPADIAAPAADYAHAVLTEDATRWLHTSGVVPVAPDGSTPDALADQAALVWTNIAALLRDAEMAATNNRASRVSGVTGVSERRNSSALRCSASQGIHRRA